MEIKRVAVIGARDGFRHRLRLCGKGCEVSITEVNEDLLKKNRDTKALRWVGWLRL